MQHLLFATALCAPAPVLAEDVTIRNLMRAESDTMFRLTMQTNGTTVGEIARERQVTSADAPQPIIRANQDTLYSVAIIDLSEPVTVTLPEGDGRFQSVLVISQDHHNFAYADPGSYELTEDEGETRFGISCSAPLKTQAIPTMPPAPMPCRTALFLKAAEPAPSRRRTEV
jgi:hypothetical protein